MSSFTDPLIMEPKDDMIIWTLRAPFRYWIDKLHEGDVLTLRVIRIDSQRRRMGLSLKRVSDPEYADLDWRAEYAASLAAEAGDEDADLAPSEGEPDASCEFASDAVPAEPEELEARERSPLS